MPQAASAPPFQPLLRPTATAASLAVWLGLGLFGVLGLGLPALAQQAAAPAASAASAAGPTLRPETAKPLMAAQDQLKAGNYKEALARVAEAEALPGLTPYEAYVIRRMKAPATYGAGDLPGATAQFETLIDDPLLPQADRGFVTETTIKLALQQKEYPRAAKWMKQYLSQQGQDAEIRRLYPQVLSLNGDHAGAAAEFKTLVAAEEAASRPVPEATLRMLASSQSQASDDAGYLVTLEKLAASTGKADYWGELIARAARRDGFASERLRLDLYRLRRAVGAKLSAGELGDMAFRAHKAGLPAEAQKLLDDGFGSQLLGQDGNAAADRELRTQATKAAAQDQATLADSEASLRSAKDGNAAFNLGLALSAAGQHDKALGLMAQGQTKGGLRRPDDALLHLGLVQWRAGQLAAARQTFASVGGSDGTDALAHLWVVYLDSPAAK